MLIYTVSVSHICPSPRIYVLEEKLLSNLKNKQKTPKIGLPRNEIKKIILFTRASKIIKYSGIYLSAKLTL